MEGQEDYLDVVKGELRPRRGVRKHGRGPMSAAEKRMSRAFQKMMASLHRMDGELADVTAADMAVLFTRALVICEKYSWKNWPDVDGLDLHIVRNELDIIVEQPNEDVDVYRDLLA